MTKSLILGCKTCNKQLGLLIISTPLNLSPLIHQCIIYDDLTPILPKNSVLIAKDMVDFDEGMAKVKNLEVEEKQFYDRYEIVSEKFKESHKENKNMIEDLKLPRHTLI